MITVVRLCDPCDPYLLLNDLANFAETLVMHLKKAGRTRRKPHRFAGFMVLKAPDIPSLLIETAFISNPAEEKKFLRAWGLPNGVTDVQWCLGWQALLELDTTPQVLSTPHTCRCCDSQGYLKIIYIWLESKWLQDNYCCRLNKHGR